MKRVLFSLTAFLAVFAATWARAADFEVINVWPDVAPGETADAEKPTLRCLKPENKTSDACVIVCPGGAYNNLDKKESDWVARLFAEHGITAVVLRYRVPRREGQAKHLAPWQDAQRAVRVVRARAQEWGVDPDKIGILGFSACGHLTLMTATTSLTNSYEPIDDIDKLSASVAFAVPIYPAYVLEDGADGPNSGKGNDSAMVQDFAFDANTPPICLFHGDADVYSPMGSIAVYSKLRTMNVPAELHVFTKVNHGFVGHVFDEHVGSWPERTLAWLQKLGFVDGGL